MIGILKKRRSIRKYMDVPIEEEKIYELTKAALLSPSSRGRRPWEFVVVTDKGLLYKLSMCRDKSSSFLKEAPLGIVVMADESKCDVWTEDTAIAAIIIQLTAVTMGLGSCWIQVREREHDDELTAEEYIRKTLNIPDNYKIECILSIGYPDEIKEPYNESTLKYESVHKNVFGKK